MALERLYTFFGWSCCQFASPWESVSMTTSVEKSMVFGFVDVRSNSGPLAGATDVLIQSFVHQTTRQHGRQHHPESPLRCHDVMTRLSESPDLGWDLTRRCATGTFAEDLAEPRYRCEVQTHVVHFIHWMNPIKQEINLSFAPNLQWPVATRPRMHRSTEICNSDLTKDADFLFESDTH